MDIRNDTLVFIPAWNEEDNLPAVLDGAAPRAAGRGRSRHRRRLDRRHGRGRARRTAPRSSRSATNRGLRPASRPATARRPTQRLRVLRARRRRRAAPGRRAAAPARAASGRGVRRRRRLAVRDRRGLRGAALHAEPRAPLRHLAAAPLDGRRCCAGRSSTRPAACTPRTRKALPILALPYTSEAPEVQAILRLHDAGLRVDEVPVHMRERASGESKLQGKKAVMLVLTVVVHAVRGRRAAGSASAMAEPVRVVAVLGYSAAPRREPARDRASAASSRRAASPRARGAVVLSGWSRRPGGRGEAELMRAAWAGPTCRCSSSTRRRARRSGTPPASPRRRSELAADEVVVVTSSLAPAAGGPARPHGAPRDGDPRAHRVAARRAAGGPAPARAGLPARTPGPARARATGGACGGEPRAPALPRGERGGNPGTVPPLSGRQRRGNSRWPGPERPSRGGSGARRARRPGARAGQLRGAREQGTKKAATITEFRDAPGRIRTPDHRLRRPPLFL